MAAANVPLDMIVDGTLTTQRSVRKYERWTFTAVADGNQNLADADIQPNVILRNAQDAARQWQFRTAAQIVAAHPGAQVGDTFQFLIVNGGNNTITLVGGGGVTITSHAIAANTTKVVTVLFTNVTAAGAAVTVY